MKGQIKVFEDRQCTEYCPVKLYEEYMRKRPEAMCTPESRFYLQPKKFTNGTSAQKAEVWYKVQPHGINAIKQYMHAIVEKAGIPDDVSLSNISARKHLVSTCKRAGVPDSTTIKVRHFQTVIANE